MRNSGRARRVTDTVFQDERCARGTNTWRRSGRLTYSRSAWGRRVRTQWGPGAAQHFVTLCQAAGIFAEIVRIQIALYGSLAKTGKGHGTDVAVLLGLSGVDPVTCDTTQIHPQVAAIEVSGKLVLGGDRVIEFTAEDLVFHRSTSLSYHPNALTFTAFLSNRTTRAETYYSVGGGFVVREGETHKQDHMEEASLPLPVTTATNLLEHCRNHGLTIPEVVWRNECVSRSPVDIHTGLERIWATMCSCVFRVRIQQAHYQVA